MSNRARCVGGIILIWTGVQFFGHSVAAMAEISRGSPLDPGMLPLPPRVHLLVGIGSGLLAVQGILLVCKSYKQGKRILTCEKCGEAIPEQSIRAWQLVLAIALFPLGLLAFLAKRGPRTCPKCKSELPSGFAKMDETLYVGTQRTKARRSL